VRFKSSVDLFADPGDVGQSLGMTTATTPSPPGVRHVVQVDVPPADAWRYWIHVENWAVDAAIAHVRLDGPFRVGARGETVLRGGSEVVRWSVVEVVDGRRAVVEIPAGGLVARFTWRFDPLPRARTRLTQEITVHGPDSGADAAAAAALAQTVPAGMARLAAAMERRHSGEP
jgi:hypothetical protein